MGESSELAAADATAESEKMVALFGKLILLLHIYFLIGNIWHDQSEVSL